MHEAKRLKNIFWGLNQLNSRYEYAGNQLVFYLHCAKEGHKLDVMQENPHVCVELETNVELVSGGDVPCKYGASFASVFGRGKAELVENEQEKIKGLKLLMQKDRKSVV